MLTNMPNVITA